MLGALVLVLAAASNDDSGTTGDPRSLDLLAVALLALGGGLINLVTVIAFHRLGRVIMR